MLDCIDKAQQSILENSIAEKNGQIHRTDRNTPQTNLRKNMMSSKKTTLEKFLQLSVHADMK